MQRRATEDAKWFASQLDAANQILEDAVDVADRRGGLSDDIGAVSAASTDIRRNISKKLDDHAKAVKKTSRRAGSSLTLRQVKSLMQKHNLPGELSGRGANWELEVPNERAKKVVEKVIPGLGGYRSGHGSWVLSQTYQSKGDWNDPSSRHHYAAGWNPPTINKTLSKAIAKVVDKHWAQTGVKSLGDIRNAIGKGVMTPMSMAERMDNQAAVKKWTAGISRDDLHKVFRWVEEAKNGRGKEQYHTTDEALRKLKTAGSVGMDMLFGVVDRKGLIEVQRVMQKAGDEQSVKLLREVQSTLIDKLSLDRGAEEAMNRLAGLASRGKSWEPALIRNNIFKAANSLGIKLPSGMFASQTKQAMAGSLFILKNDVEVIYDPFTHILQVGMGGEWWAGKVKPGKNVFRHRKERGDEAYRPVTVHVEQVGHAYRFAIGGGFGMGTTVMLGFK